MAVSIPYRNVINATEIVSDLKDEDEEVSIPYRNVINMEQSIFFQRYYQVSIPYRNVINLLALFWMNGKNYRCFNPL